MANKSQVEKAQELLERTLRDRYETTQNIRRVKEKVISIPDYMTPRDAAQALISYDKEQEETVQSLVELKCHWRDGLVAFYRAMTDQFGKLIETTNYSWFGPTPGRTERIQIDYNESITVPTGNVKVPGLPVELSIGYEENQKNVMESKVAIRFTFKRMYEPLIKDIENGIRDQLRNNSIFKGKAIDSKFDFLNLNSASTRKLVYSAVVRNEIDAYIRVPILQRKELTKRGFSLKRTVLLSGPYGCGKTLTGLDTAYTAVQNGWTFYMVRVGDSIVTALRFAKLFEPCVVFFEDVDEQAAETSGVRTTDLNNVLNEIDGILGKDDHILLLVTTNHPENIAKAMFRPGRIDHEIDMGQLDAESVANLVRVYADGQLRGDLDAEALFLAAKDYPHAFISGATKDAQLFAMAVRPNDTSITNDDVIKSLIALRPQYDRMIASRVVEEITVDKTMSDLVDERVAPIKQKVSEILDHVS